MRRPGEPRFAAPVRFAPGAAVSGWSAGVTPAGDVVVAWKDGEKTGDPQGGGVLHFAVAPAGGPFGRPAVLAGHVFAMAGAGAALTWTEGRPKGAYETDKRVLHAALAHDVADGGPASPGSPVDRTAPRLRLRVVAVKGRRVRVAVRSSERASLRATWRSAPGRCAARRARCASRHGRRRQRPQRRAHGAPAAPLIRSAARTGNGTARKPAWAAL